MPAKTETSSKKPIKEQPGRFPGNAKPGNLFLGQPLFSSSSKAHEPHNVSKRKAKSENFATSNAWNWSRKGYRKRKKTRHKELGTQGLEKAKREATTKSIVPVKERIILPASFFLWASSALLHKGVAFSPHAARIKKRNNREVSKKTEKNTLFSVFWPEPVCCKDFYFHLRSILMYIFFFYFFFLQTPLNLGLTYARTQTWHQAAKFTTKTEERWLRP